MFLSQLINTIETIRKEFVVAKKFSEEIRRDPVRVNENGEIWIGEKYIEMEFRLKILYLGFLKSIDGISSPLQCEDREIFEKIYYDLSDNPSEFAMQKVFCKTVKYKSGPYPNNPKFHSYKRKVNDALKSLLGDSLSKFYEIHRLPDEGGKFFFRVMLQKEEIKFPEKFTKPTRSTR